MRRRKFIKNIGLISGLIPFGLTWNKKAFAQAADVQVYKVINGDYAQNTSKLCDMLGMTNYIDPSDVVVIKGNAQWPYQGYTHTGVIKVVIDKILDIPGFSGEVIICDNVQVYGKVGEIAFDVPPDKRTHNWPDHNWSTLAAEYQENGKPVSVKQWVNSQEDISSPADGEGWIRDYFSFHDIDTFLSYPIFESPITPGRMIDMKNGVWENGDYSGRNVKAIFMPNLNNHGRGSEDNAGVTSAIKSFYGATEIHDGVRGKYKNHNNIHASSFFLRRADYAGELVARYINTMYQPVLYITAAIWSGHYSRTGDAVETKAVLACENPVTLDYIACRDIISPYAEFLNPDLDNNTRKQITGCISGGIGTINPAEYELITYDFNDPSVIYTRSNDNLPAEFRLYQNYPNPFNATTKITFTLPKSENVSIEIFNTQGKRIEVILQQTKRAGQHQITYDPSNLASGVYYYRITAGRFQQVRKMILNK